MIQQLNWAAHNCIRNPTRKTEWFEAFQKIIRDHKIDPTQKYSTTDKTLIDLLLEDLREAAIKTYKEVRSGVEKVAKKVTEEIFTQAIPATTAKILEQTSLQSPKQNEKF